MKPFVIKKAKGKGKGVFATRDIKKGERVIYCDLSRLKSYSVNDIPKHPLAKNPKYENHWDEAGRGKWVLDLSPASYVNHSCNPNLVTKYYTFKKKVSIALRDIKKGEELTVDYSQGAPYGFETSGYSLKNCKCGEKNCRKNITADFFKLPIKLQRRYYPYLLPHIKRKYRKRFAKLRL